MLDGLAEFCAEVLARTGCASASVAVVERDEVTYAEAFGTADAEQGRAAEPGTVYGLASATKPLTAAAVCVAVDDGLLAWDEPVPTPAGARPTVRQLLLHRGGLGPFYDFHYGEGPTPVDPDRYMLRFAEPGEGFGYANLGYLLLGRALERASGRGLAEFVRERVFEPLGLRHCHVGRTYQGYRAPVAARYTPDGRRYPPADTSHPGATLGWAPAGELAMFTRTYESLLRPETAAAVKRADPIHDGLGYGLGWCVARADGGRPFVQSHGGGMGGVAAMTIGVPDRELAVTVLTNSTDKTARDAVVAHVMAELVPGWTADRIGPVAADPERPFTLPRGEYAGWIETPEGEVPLTVRVLDAEWVELRLGGRDFAVPAAASRSWDLRAAVPFQLPTADARINSPSLWLALRRDPDRPGGGLSGIACSYKDGDTEGRLGSFLPHHCRLTGVPAC